MKTFLFILLALVVMIVTICVMSYLQIKKAKTRVEELKSSSDVTDEADNEQLKAAVRFYNVTIMMYPNKFIAKMMKLEKIDL